ncbi:hypothetical protein V3M69_00810 [Trueperella pyogenes]|uniref:hypothetical protein n=1 Tax=Trueperella pyogenes TaxID=1661 RepID=UPI00143327DF|nr:hypothetical protein [Trueperella pyogenes]QIU87101.1 hypothetical protein HEP79_07675 [Trueperella pyogenes]
MNSAQYEQGRWLQAEKSHDMRVEDVREADDALRDDTAAHYTTAAEAKLRAVLQGDYTPAAREREVDRFEGLGEEYQNEK